MFESYESEEKEREEFWKQLGECTGYMDTSCPKCGRYRVEHWSGGKSICEKCRWCVEDEAYFDHPFFNY